MTPLTRHFVLKLIGLSSAVVGGKSASVIADQADNADQPQPADPSQLPHSNATIIDWTDTNDRVWLGGEAWANPMENWRVVDDWAECQSGAGDRNIHLLTNLDASDGNHANQFDGWPLTVRKDENG